MVPGFQGPLVPLILMSFQSPSVADRASWGFYAEEKASECSRPGAQATEEPGVSRQEGQAPAGQEEETGGAEAEEKVWLPTSQAAPSCSI